MDKYQKSLNVLPAVLACTLPFSPTAVQGGTNDCACAFERMLRGCGKCSPSIGSEQRREKTATAGGGKGTDSSESLAQLSVQTLANGQRTQSDDCKHLSATQVKFFS